MSTIKKINLRRLAAAAVLGMTAFTTEANAGVNGMFGEGSPGNVSVEHSTGNLRAGYSFIVPSARGDAQPALSLAYSSAGQRGRGGVGWEFDVPTITTRSLAGPPGAATYDRYEFDGSPLVRVCSRQALQCNVVAEPIPDWATSWDYYRLQDKPASARFFLSPDRRTWRVQWKSGETLEFGQPRVAPGLGEVAIDETTVGEPLGWLAPATDSMIHRWYLVRRFDAQGGIDTPANIILYFWERHGTSQVRYLTHVYDTPANGFAGAASTSNYAHHLAVSYKADPSPSPGKHWHAQPDWHATRIDVSSRAMSGSGQRELVRRYHLGYGTMLERSYLSSIQMEGRCDQPIAESASGNLPEITACPVLPATKYSYSTASLSPTPIELHVGPTGAMPFSPAASIVVFDVDRDGLPDVVRRGSETDEAYLNRLHGPVNLLSRERIGRPSQLINQAEFVDAFLGVNVAGYWGTVNETSILFRTNNVTATEDDYVAIRARRNPVELKWLGADSRKLRLPKIQTIVDFNGDGLVDALSPSNDVFLTVKNVNAYNDYVQPFQRKYTANLPARIVIGLDSPPEANFTRQVGTFADLDGDGLPDYVLADYEAAVGSSLGYMMNAGSGQFVCSGPNSRCVPLIQNCGVLNPNCSAKYLKIRGIDPFVISGVLQEAPGPQGLGALAAQPLFHDLNADGRADFVFLDKSTTPARVRVWLNEDGENFREIIQWNTLQCDPKSRITFADMNGSGTDDIVVIEDGAAHYIDFLAGESPGLLTEISRDGASVHFTYKSSAELVGGPEKPMRVVARASMTTGLPAPYSREEVREYDYSNAIFDSWERRIIGFANVREKSKGGGASAETYRKFNRGRCPEQPGCGVPTDNDPERATRGALLSEITYDAGGKAQKETRWSYVTSTGPTGMDGRKVRFGYVSTIDQFLYESGDPYAPSRHLHGVQFVNELGDRTASVDYGEVDAQGVSLDGQIASHATYYPLTSAWQSRLQTTILDSGQQPGMPPVPSRRTTFQYDSFGRLTEVYGKLEGTASLRRGHEDPSKQTAAHPTTRSSDRDVLLSRRAYDGFGNLIQLEGPGGARLGGCTTFGYDTMYKHLPTVATAWEGECRTSVGRSTIASFDRGFEAATMTIAPNQYQTNARYDHFGRLLEASESSPSNSFQLQTALTNEYIAPTGGRLHYVRSWTPAGEGWTYLDAFNTPILQLRQADPGAGDAGRWVASGLGSAQDGTVRKYEPWFFDGAPMTHAIAPPAAPAMTTIVDAFGRVSQTFGLDGMPSSRLVYHALSADLYDAEDLKAGGNHTNTPTTIVKDGHGRVVQTIARSQTEQITTSLKYNASGELAMVSESSSLEPTRGVTRWMQYDSFGRLVANVEPNAKGYKAPTTYDGSGQWHYAYDDSGKLVGTSDPRGCGKNLTYDGFGRLLGEDYSPCRNSHPLYSAPKGRDGYEAYYVYDNVEDPNSTLPSVVNGAVGQLSAVYDRGAHTRFEYDARSRLMKTSRRVVRPGEASPFIDDRYATDWFHSATAYDDADRVAMQTTGAAVPDVLGTNNSSALYFKYSKRGVLQEIDSSYGPLWGSPKYEADGNLRSLTLGNGAASVNNTYDALRRVQTYTVKNTVAPLNQVPFAYATTLAKFKYSYDAVDNPVQITDGRLPAEWAPGAKPMSRTVEYDNLYRVARVAYDSASDLQVSPFAADFRAGSPAPIPHLPLAKRVQSQNFTYDFRGNQTGSSDDATAFYDRSLGKSTFGSALDGPDQLRTSQGTNGEKLLAAYDAAGHLTDLAVWYAKKCPASTQCAFRYAYDWDEVGRLARARRWESAMEFALTSRPTSTPIADLTYAHGADSQRVLKTVRHASAPEAHSVEVFPSLRLNQANWDANNLTYERSAKTETAYLAGIARVQPMPAWTNGKPQHLLLSIRDHLGSTGVVMDQETGEIVESVSHQAYGATESDYRTQRWNDFREDYRFTGKEDDIEVGIAYFGARYYHPLLRRWLSPDPLTIHAVGADINPYAYVHASPLRLTDPFGYQACIGKEQVCYSSGGSGDGGGGVFQSSGGPVGDAGLWIGQKIGAGISAIGGGIGDLVSSGWNLAGGLFSGSSKYGPPAVHPALDSRANVAGSRTASTAPKSRWVLDFSRPFFDGTIDMRQVQAFNDGIRKHSIPMVGAVGSAIAAGAVLTGLGAAPAIEGAGLQIGARLPGLGPAATEIGLGINGTTLPRVAAGAGAAGLGTAAAEGDTASRAIQMYWPPNRGFLTGPVEQVLHPGTLLDRFGHEGGTFVSPKGIPFEMRGLDPASALKPYFSYEVLQPINAKAGLAAPAFGYIGNGMQYELPSAVQVLVGNGSLRRLP